MTITDVMFLFFFLPFALVVYYLGKESYRKYILLVLSLVFYACGAPEYVLLLLLSLVINILAGKLIARPWKGKLWRGLILLAGIGYNVLVLLYYKYFDFIASNINILLRTKFAARNLILPLGLSFFTFKAISYLVDTYKGKIQAGNNCLIDVALYLSFFGQIQSGPLSRYQDMNNTVKDTARFYTWNQFSEGAWRFIIGFNKKILLANILANITQETFSAADGTISVSYAWLGGVCYTLQLFFDFSGYSDMAIGISRMFGYTCPENFRYPYIATSISEFWRRWHITLGAWFRDYIYIPLGGSRVDSKFRLYMNLLAVWLFTGIWHGASWNFIFWGLSYFVVIAFEKTTGYPDKLKARHWKYVYRIFVLLFVNFQWVIFRANGLKAGIRYIKNMICAPPNPLADIRTVFLLTDNFVFIVAAILLCFPIVPTLENWCKKKGEFVLNFWNAGLLITNMALFLWAVSFVIAGQNNPFAYANF